MNQVCTDDIAGVRSGEQGAPGHDPKTLSLREGWIFPYFTMRVYQSFLEVQRCGMQTFQLSISLGMHRGLVHKKKCSSHKIAEAT